MTFVEIDSGVSDEFLDDDELQAAELAWLERQMLGAAAIGEGPEANDTSIPPDAIGLELAAIAYTRFGNYLLRFAESKVGNHEVAEDIVSEVYLKLAARETPLLNNSFLKTYMTTAIINRTTSYWRHQNIVTSHTNDLFDIGYDDTEEIALEHSEHAILLAALRKLPRSQREALVFKVLGRFR